MKNIDNERLSELRDKLGNILHLAALDGRNDDVSDLIDILSVLDSYSGLAEENAALRVEVASLEDEVLTHHEILAESVPLARAEKAEAELARWKPLIEAVMGAVVRGGYSTDTGKDEGRFSEQDARAIILAALKGREGAR